jgi:transposase
MVYIGIDLHRKRSQVAALDDQGELLFNRRVPTRQADLFEVLASAGETPVEVVFEATFGWGWLADLLADAGIPTHMAHPLATKAISAGRVKNDSIDAKTLAHLLRTNLLPEAWLAPPGRARRGDWFACVPPWSGSERVSRTRSMPCWPSMGWRSR